MCRYSIAIMKKLDWDDLRFFLAVAAAGSLSAAARELGVNTTTVLRRIASLEEALQARLFERLRSGYALTQEGTRLMETLEPVDQRLTSLSRDFQAGATSLQGTVRLGASDIIASGFVAPSLGRFRAEKPDIALDLVTDPSLTGPGAAPRVLNALRDVDLALRLARPTQGDMLVRKLGDVAYGLYATPSYIERFGTVPISGDLSGHQIVGFSPDDRPLGPIWWLSRAERNARVIMRSSNAAVRLGTVMADEALAALPCFEADRLSGLERIAGPDLIGGLELWLLTRSDLAQLGHVRAVMDFLVAEVKARTPELSGR